VSPPHTRRLDAPFGVAPSSLASLDLGFGWTDRLAVYDKLSHLGSQILQPQSADITKPDTLTPALEGASAVVSLVGVLVGDAKVMEKVQKEGAENVARVSRELGVKRTIMISAIGADALGETP